MRSVNDRIRSMPSLSVHKDFQRVRRLDFCYSCGEFFKDGDRINGDHVPPKSAFAPRDRNNPLKLATHWSCNDSYKTDDKKLGQLIAARRGEGPRSRRDHALEFRNYPGLGVALENLNVDATVWRWIKAFHAALYRVPLLDGRHAIVTPFPRGDRVQGGIQVQPIREQDLKVVEVIKTNRILGQLDTIRAYNNKLRYECVWCIADDGVNWFCCFALDLYDWKQLGSSTDGIPARGCFGLYSVEGQVLPDGATVSRETPIEMPNVDALDPFAP